MLIKPSDTKWKNVWILHLLQSHNFLLKAHYQKNTSVLALSMLHETRRVKPKKAFRVLSCVIYTITEKLFLYWLSSLSLKKLSEIFCGF